MYLHPGVHFVPVPIEHLEEPFPGALVEHSNADPRAKQHRLDDILRDAFQFAMCYRVLKIVDGENFFGFLLAEPIGRPAEPGLRLRPGRFDSFDPRFDSSAPSAVIQFVVGLVQQAVKSIDPDGSGARMIRHDGIVFGRRRTAQKITQP